MFSYAKTVLIFCYPTAVTINLQHNRRLQTLLQHFHKHDLHTAEGTLSPQASPSPIHLPPQQVRADCHSGQAKNKNNPEMERCDSKATLPL